MHYFIISLLALTMGLGSACSKNDDSVVKVAEVEFPTESIIQLLSTNGVTRLELFCIPEETCFVSNLHPDDVERLANFKIVAKYFRLSKLQKELITALRESDVKQFSSECDLRWGCVFYNDANDRVLTMYFDQFGQGEINGHRVQSCKKIMALLRKRCSPLWK